jgi:flagellar biosynthesis GTPase FlhF
LDGSSARYFEQRRLRQRTLVGADVFRRLATGLYVAGLIVILLALAKGSQTLCLSVLVLAGTISDIRITRKGASKISQSGGLGRTLRRVGGQTIVLAFVLLDIAGLGFTLVAPIWLAPWMTMNVTALLLGTLSWSEHRRLQRESAAARKRQAEKMREAQRRNLEERQRETQRQQEAERHRQAEQLREAERRRQQAEELRRQAEEECEAHRQHQRERERTTAQWQTQWWRVLEVASSAGKDEIVLNYRRKIKQYHPDRLTGLAPELLELAEERTKALNLAYAQAIRDRR